METEEQIAALPEAMIALDQSGMRCEGERCVALAGVVGEKTGCTVYAMRPQVCRECEPGGEDCHIARRRYGLPIDTAPRLER